MRVALHRENAFGRFEEFKSLEMRVVPRLGELVVVDQGHYQVHGVAYLINDSGLDEPVTTVSIRLEKL